VTNGPMSTANQFRQTARKSESRPCYRFGPFVLDTVQHALLKQGTPVALTPKTYDTLLLLVQNNGRMLSKEELMQTLWPDSFVEESNLTQQVSMVRKAVGESANDPRYIVTVPGCGYRFNAELNSGEDKKDRTYSNSLAQLLVYPGDQSGERQAGIAQTNASAAKAAELIPAPHASHDPKGHRWILLSLAALAVLAIAAIIVTKFPYVIRPKPIQPIAPRTLAILPLQNLKQDSASEFLGFSLADAVITKLDYVSSLIVRPSSAVEKYRGKVIDIAAVAADLKVDTLLTGSFLRDGDDLRITYQLIDVKTEKILGRGTVDLKYDNLLRVQDQVAEEIIRKLEVNLSPSETERIKPEAQITPLAYEYYLRGLDLHGRHEFPMAIKMLEKSTEIDPNYALAWAYLGASYTSDAAFELGGRGQYHRAQAAYERALEIQPSQMDAQMFLANLFVDTGEVERAVPLLRNALKTNDNYAPVHWEMGYAYRFAGMLKESVAECERARQIDPVVKSNGSVLNTYLYLGQYDKFLRSLPDVNDSSFYLFYRGLGEYYERDFERASKDFDRAYEVDPTLYVQIGKALSNSIAHRRADGLEILRGLESKITERGVGDPEAAYKVAQAFAVLGDKVSALRMLRRSVESGFFCYPYVAADPLLNSLRSEPEFGQILEIARQRHEAFKASFF
jgi:DNA-binding winged helix-turn-helix (wHTH) protein/TolB-like protein/Tfp pilus assembly protein PilF